MLILGAGRMQMPAITEALRMGFRTAVADINPDAPGAELADLFLNIDLKDRHGIAAAAVRLRQEENLAGVFTAGTDFSATVAYAAAAAGLPGIDYSTALTASNKILMRRAFDSAGIPSPGFYPVRNLEEALEAGARLEFPVVIKPVDSMGARGVVRIDSIAMEKEIEKAVSDAVKVSRSSEAIIEEYMDGPEFSIDAIVNEGEVTICGFADRHIFFPPYFIEMGHTMPADVSEKVYSDVVGVFRDGVKAIGIDNGAAKGDMKYTARHGAMVGEIAARLSGGFMSGWTFPYSSGVNLTAAALNIAAGMPPGDLDPVRNDTSAERAAISIPGVICSIHGMEAAGSAEYVRDVFLNTSAGSVVSFPVNNVQKCANVITSAPTRKLAVNAAEQAVRRLFFRLEPGNSDTAAFLSGRGREWVPDAFNLDDSSSRDWHGTGIDDAVEAVRLYTSCTGSEMTPDFWRSFSRGGIQGAVWHIETARLEEGS